jgi:hypothetical protein
LHPRTLPVQGAGAAIRTELDRLQREHDLTDVEMHRILLHYMDGVAKGWLQAERHPDDPDRKADEA